MIKIYFTLCILLFSTSFAFAQQDTTLVYSRPGYTKDPTRADLKRIIEKKDSLWTLTLYDKKGVLQEKITFTDEKLEVRKGSYQLYTAGNLKLEGNYSRGYKVGEWNSYYPNKQLFEKANYLWGKKNGNWKIYWDNGQLKEEANYSLDKKIGHQIQYYKNGTISAKELYDENGLVIASYYDESGKPIKNL
jgi:antitoxin component YwqK of YwqJK toxin-antitoxin module